MAPPIQSSILTPPLRPRVEAYHRGSYPECPASDTHTKLAQVGRALAHLGIEHSPRVSEGRPGH